MASKRDVELLLRATDLASKPFADVSAAIASLTAKLAQQTEAAGKGNVSVKELAVTLRQLTEAGDALVKQQAVIDLYKKLETQLEGAQGKAETARQRFEALRATLAALETPTTAQTASLGKLETAYNRAVGTVQSLQDRLAAQSATLARVGIDTGALAEAELRLTEAASVAGQARGQAQASLDGYDAKLRAHRAELAATAAAEKEAAAAAAEAARQAAEARKADPSLGGRDTEAVAAFQAQLEAAKALRERNEYEAALTKLLNENALAEKAATDATKTRTAALIAEYEAAEKAAEAEARRSGPRDLAPSGGSAADVAKAAAQVQAAENLRREIEYQKLFDEAIRQTALDEAHLAAEEENVAREINAQTAALKKLNEENAKQKAAGQTGFLGLKGYELQNLSFQVNDIVTGLVSGQRVTQIAAQQGGQVFQIFQGQVVSFLKLNPLAVTGITLLAGAFITLFAAVARVQNTTQSVRDFTAQLAVSSDGAKSNATQIVAVQRELQRLGAGFDDAGTALKSFLAAGVSDPSTLTRFGKTAQDLVEIFGVKLPDAAKAVADAFKGGYDSVKRLDDEYNVFTATQREQIRALFDAGKAAEAQALAQGLANQKLDDARKLAEGPLTAALRAAKLAAFDFLDTLGNSFVARLAVGELQLLARGLENWLRTARILINMLPNFPGATSGLDEANAQLKAVTDQIAKLDQQSATGARKGIPNPSGFDEVRNRALAEQARLLGVVADAQKRVNGGTGTDGGAAADQKAADATERRTKATQDYLDAQNRRISQAKGLDDAARLEAVRVEATRKADEAHLTDAGKQIAVDREVAEERRKIIEENRGLSETISNGLDALRAAADKSDKANLDNRIRAIDEQYKHLYEKIADYRRKGQTEIDGVPLDKVASDARAAQEQLKASERVKFAKEQAAEAEKGIKKQETLENELAALTSAADKAQTESLQARLAAIDAQYSHIFVSIAAAQRAGVSTAGGVSLPDFRAQVEQQKQFLKDAETTKFYEQNLNQLVQSRDATMKSILDSVKDGTTSAGEGYAQAQAANDKIAPKITKMAQDALTFAKALNAARPSPQLDAFIAKTERTLGQSSGTGKTSALGQFGEQDEAAGLQKINALTQTRSALQKEYQALADKGVITQREANENTKAAFEGLAPQIEDAARELEKFIDAASSTMPAYQINLLKAKLAEVRAEVKYADPEWTKLKNTIEDSFANRAVTALEDITTAIGGAIAKTQSWGDALKAVGVAAAQFFAGLLADIAKAILKEEALALIKSLFAGVAHEGGLVTAAGTGGISRAVDPTWFIGAPRYHNGAVVGLGPDEQAAILQHGEEVLAKDDPRNILNSVRKAGAAGSASTNIRSVLVLDNGLIPQAMQSSEGEQVTMSHIKKNVATIRQLIR